MSMKETNLRSQYWIYYKEGVIQFLSLQQVSCGTLIEPFVSWIWECVPHFRHQIFHNNNTNRQ